MTRATAFALVAAVSAGRAGAQEIRKSQVGTVTQTIAHTRIEIRYHRPTARGRELFGALVPWSHLWSPSADTAAVVTVSEAITINGDSLPAGTFSLWAIPDRESWTLVFSRDHPTFHTRYREGNDALRVRAVPRAGEHMESLGLYFPAVDADSAELVVHWGTTVVPLKIKAK